jgi:SAM-dependent methyltransferase
MGRFETAAEFYRFREPYPPEFFEAVVTRLGLNRETRMLDVGCGPGNLAIGFAPFVGGCVAIDIEPEMLRVARAAAQTDIEFLQVAIEDLDARAGEFDFVTIGRAIHWLARDATLAVLDRVTGADARIAVCAATATEAQCNAWNKKFREVRTAWSSDPDESRYRPDLEKWFAGSRFSKLDEIAVNKQYRVTVDHLLSRALSFSITSPAVLGDKREAFEAAMRSALEPFATDGALEEEVVAKAWVFG